MVTTARRIRRWQGMGEVVASAQQSTMHTTCSTKCVVGETWTLAVAYRSYSTTTANGYISALVGGLTSQKSMKSHKYFLEQSIGGKEENVWRLQVAQPQAADLSSCANKIVDCSAYCQRLWNKKARRICLQSRLCSSKTKRLEGYSFSNQSTCFLSLQGFWAKETLSTQKKMVCMEGAALSGMLNILANKLAPLAIKQYSFIVGVTKDLQDLQVLVEEINCWLEKAGYEAMGSDQLWLRQLKHVAYDFDDIVDEFHLEAEKHEADGGNHAVSKYLITKAKSLLFKFKAARKIQVIKERFAAIVKQRTDFSAIVNSLPDGHPVPHINRTARAIPTLPIVNETLVCGRDQEKHEIISKLLDNDNQRIIKIVSIIGLGGCGKTTLAKLVFNDGKNVKAHFEVKIWVHVSQEFDVEKLVKKLFEAVSGEKSESYPLQQMAKTISDKLTGKRYLVVLDDVWTEDRIQWDEFMVHMKSGAAGSSIMLTTRSRKVAEALESTDLFTLPFLSEVDSWALFIQRFGMALNGLDSEFLEVAREIVKKCGVPLAIKVLAGVLREKRMIEEWKAIRDSNLLDIEDKEQRIFACLRLSYFHLPSYLKQCFTMCSLFPKGHRIYKEQLIELWIAHDMISLTPGVDYLEDIGDEHFDSLVQVSFLQDVDEEYGRGICKMHDLVHDLARSIMREEISTNGPEDASSSTKGYRYFSLIERPRKPFPKRVFKNARAIFVDKGKDIIFGEALENAKHLRSVIVNFSCSTTELTAIFRIKNLKYLEISQLQCESLPEAISDIWGLQAVHLIDCHRLHQLPKSFGKLQKLRTLDLSGCWKLECLPDSIGNCNMLSSIVLCKCIRLTALPKSVGKLQTLRMLNLWYSTELKSLPDSIGDCKMLTSINLNHCKLAAMPNSIGRNRSLRVLRLGHTDIEKLPSSITTMRNLECLDLSGCWKLVELPEGIGNLEKLQVLNLKICSNLVELPEGIINLERLRVLNLEYCTNLVELPKGIGKLEKLQVLNLKRCDALRGMPVGIEQLSRIEKLSLFVVGEGEKFARISELANVGRDSEGLIIKDIEHVLEQDDANKACLKWKKNLQSLKLEWGRYYKGEVKTELEETVLDGLEPPPGIKELEISWYSGRKYARWMQNQVGGEVKGLANFQFLRVMKLSDFLKLKHLDGLVELPCLEKLELRRMPSLESISGGPFPSLVKLEIKELQSLEEVWMVAERTMSDGEEGGSCRNHAHHLGQVQVGNCLTCLDIMGCPKLKMKTFLHLSGHLTHWELTGQLNMSSSSFDCSCSRLRRDGHDWVLRQNVPALESLDVLFSNAPERLGSLASLQSLSLSHSSEIGKLPESLGAFGSLQKLSILNCNNLSSLPRSMGQLTSLQVLEIKSCQSLRRLPECLGELSSLRTLHVEGLCSMKSFPQSLRHLTSLQHLTIVECSTLRELPIGLGDLASLCELTIQGLPYMTCFPQSMWWLTSLKKLCVAECGSLTSLPHGMEGLASLENLRISRCRRIESLPEGIRGLIALKELEIDNCAGIKSLPEGIEGLTALKKLKICGCPGIKSLPEGIKGLAALKELEIFHCEGIESLPKGIEGLTALKILKICGCTGIKSLPEGIKGLAALKELGIFHSLHRV
ncbi:hypothetical protein BS78_05G026200 [Paspalum vaginatum]|nr:hypothetical protein BS78_05G026200 [Paspalum vaginatum]